MIIERILIGVLFAWAVSCQWQIGTLAESVARLRREVERHNWGGD